MPSLWPGRDIRVAAAFVAATLVFAGACRPAPIDANRQVEPSAKAELMHTIDATHPVVTLPVPADQSAAGRKFVAVRIETVENPRKVPLTFALTFRRAGQRDIELGVFSLFPADRPGRFVVATQGRVGAGGEIVLSLDNLTHEDVADVRVGVADMRLSDD